MALKPSETRPFYATRGHLRSQEKQVFWWRSPTPPSGVSGLAVTTLRVITSATLPEWGLDVLVGRRPSSRYQLKPPGMPSGRADLRAPHQIAFAHDADQPAFLIDNGRRTDVIVQQGGGDFTNGRVHVHSDDVGDHHVCSFHDRVLLLNRFATSQLEEKMIVEHRQAHRLDDCRSRNV